MPIFTPGVVVCSKLQLLDVSLKGSLPELLHGHTEVCHRNDAFHPAVFQRELLLALSGAMHQLIPSSVPHTGSICFTFVSPSAICPSHSLSHLSLSMSCRRSKTRNLVLGFCTTAGSPSFSFSSSSVTGVSRSLMAAVFTWMSWSWAVPTCKARKPGPSEKTWVSWLD